MDFLCFLFKLTKQDIILRYNLIKTTYIYSIFLKERKNEISDSILNDFYNF